MDERKLPPPATTVEEYLYDIALGLRQLNVTLTQMMTPQPELTLSGSDVTVELKEQRPIVLSEPPTKPAKRGKGH